MLCADVELPRLFGDNMILQQKIKNTVWGWADPGEKITVKASWGAEASATADKDGKWKVFLDTPKYGTGFSLTVSGNNTINIKNTGYYFKRSILPVLICPLALSWYK